MFKKDDYKYQFKKHPKRSNAEYVYGMGLIVYVAVSSFVGTYVMVRALLKVVVDLHAMIK